MTIESQADIEGLRRVGAVVSRTLQALLAAAEPGMRTRELDALGARMLAEAGARSAPQLSYGFPGATCISLNEEAAHGVPGDRMIAAGDVLNVDVSAELDGYFADTGGSRVIPPQQAQHARLLHATRCALEAAMAEARAGARLNRIGRAIERTARAHGFRVIENLASHGTGRALHEAPGEIPGTYDPTDTRVLHEGQVITIEPFLSTRSRRVHDAGDGWTLVGAPGNRSAQFEHTMIITRGAPIVVTRH
ncbi:type I methionyl aminopeptidase [Piscinibacter sakaiensis]|uniref:Methionine aminopeptidase n=1 Tax=Piscinibacter sakaiensis TaxID=1547922 RepID=A0A0K8P148_PISS1|nr:type I methionyl aminopeptidase [Piscinibacter sakaiensis]GAP36356.1 methionine aminopeptidase [Piscinibacter sakaiensis]